MTPPTAEEIARLRGLMEKATPGEWRTSRCGDPCIDSAEGWTICWQVCSGAKDASDTGEDNAALIVAAVNALPSLLSAAERLAEGERLIADYLGKMDYCLTAENLTLDDEGERDAAEMRLRRFLAGKEER